MFSMRNNRRVSLQVPILRKPSRFYTVRHIDEQERRDSIRSTSEVEDRLFIRETAENICELRAKATGEVLECLEHLQIQFNPGSECSSGPLGVVTDHEPKPNCLKPIQEEPRQYYQPSIFHS